MPRKARKELVNSFFHLMIQGINKEYIFKDELEMKKYKKILEEYYEKFDLKIIAYCIMNNHVHLLIYTKKIGEISEFMRCVNTKYAMYYNRINNRCGYVFRNRYRAEEIFSEKHLISCINYIHNNPVKAGICTEKKEYKYSSYNDYIIKGGFVDNQIIDCLQNYGIEYTQLFYDNTECYNFMEYELKQERKGNKNEIIKQYVMENENDFEKILENKEILKKLVNDLYEICDITQNEIGESLGISRIKVQRLLHA